jgi:outer membrane protein assembly factor BamB/tetratricopeptide (TPR) repeat protein
MSKLKCARLGLLVLLALPLLAVLGTSEAQDKKLPPPDKDVEKSDKPGDPPMPMTTIPSVVTLPSDTRNRQKLEAAKDYVKTKDWPEATSALQSLLDGREDQFLQKPFAPMTDAKPVNVGSGLRAEASRVLDTLPPRGLEYYNGAQGAKAQALLRSARAQGDAGLLQEVVRRYFHTEAGAEAADSLAGLWLDRGQVFEAARLFERMLARPDADKLSPQTLFRAVTVFHMVGDRANEDAIWKRLAVKVPDGIELGGQRVALDALRTELGKMPGAPVPGDWPVYRGQADRSTRGDGDVPILEPTWKAGTISSPAAKELIEQGMRTLERTNRPLLPSAYPIATRGRLVYRSHAGIHAVETATGTEVWMRPSPVSVDAIARDSGRLVTIRSWLQMYQANTGNALEANHLPLEHSTGGVISTDGQRVYAVEDLPIPPPPDYLVQLQAGGIPRFGPLIDWMFSSRLRALDLDTGAIAWEKGGRGAGEMHNAFFLSAPLPIDGKLYTLVEKDGEIKLYCLEATRGDVLWSQRLGAFRDRVLTDPARRLRGVHMTFAGGLLICPSDSGAVFAIDPFRRELAWAFLYPTKKLAPQEGGTLFDLNAYNASCRESAPVVADGKVVYTPTDSDKVYCLNFKDGSLAWEAPQEGSLFLAGAGQGHALLVGATGVRTLNLADGKPGWTRPVGVPAGQGAVSGSAYYLPLRSSSETGGPGVLAFDMKSGKTLAFARSRAGEIPGNLAFIHGTLIAQSSSSIAVYPQLKARLERVEKLLAGKPRNPEGLIERGSLRLDQGDVTAALDDLRTALSVSTTAELRLLADAKLHEALMQAVHRDFATGEKYMAALEASCRPPVPDNASAEQKVKLDEERQRREANVLSLVARGRERQGRLGEALAAYGRLFARADGVPGLWRGEDEGWGPTPQPGTQSGFVLAPSTRPGNWVLGRVNSLLASAKPEQMADIEKEVAREWKEIPADASLADLGRFVTLFGSVGSVGLEARVAYAERLGALSGHNKFLEAEMHLLAVQRQRQVPQLAARALETLARLLTRRGLPEEALYYYRVLAAEFGKTTVRDGKTGGEILAELSLDPRFLPLMDDPFSGRHKYRTTEVRGVFPTRGMVIAMEPEGGEMPPCLQKVRLVLDFGSTTALRLLDRNTGADLWSTAVVLPNFRVMLQRIVQPGQMPNLMVTYRIEGHVAIATVGHLAYGIDLLEHRLLWTRDLGDKTTQPINNVFAFDQTGRLAVSYQDGFIQPLGRIGPIQPGVVCLTARRRLFALDPLTGEQHWALQLTEDLPEILGDEQYAYLVEGQNQGAMAVRRAVSLRGGTVRTLTPMALQIPIPFKAFGRYLAVPQTAENGGPKLAVYDCLTGKNAWEKNLPPGTFLANSEVPHLTATVEPDGKVTVYDLRARRALYSTTVEKEHLREVNEVRLIQDRMHHYLILNRGITPRDQVAQFLPNLAPGMRSVPVNGHIYAFGRGSGSLHWYCWDMQTQQLVLDRFEESPLLLFTSQIQRTNGTMVVVVDAIDKHSGKSLWTRKDMAATGNPFHAVQFNAAAGTVELISRNQRMRHSVTE